MIILKNFKSEFLTWENLISEAKLKRVFCPDISHQKFINSLKIIRPVTHKNLLTKPRFEYITSLLNQIRYYKANDVNHWLFVHDLYGISRLIKLIKKRVSNYQKLFDADIFSNFGMYSQFLVTAYLCKKLNVIDVEVKNPPLYTDILCDVRGTKIHFHVKNISESDKEEILNSAIFTIDHFLSNRSRSGNYKRTLAVSSFIGIPPDGLPKNYWIDLANSIELKSQTKKIIIDPGSIANNVTSVEIKIGFKWRDYSGTFNVPKTNFNNWRRMVTEYNKIDGNLKLESTDDCHILVAISDDVYTWNGIKKSIKDDQLGLVFINNIEFRFDRSPFLLPTKFENIEHVLSKCIPDSIEFIFK